MIQRFPFSGFEIEFCVTRSDLDINIRTLIPDKAEILKIFFIHIDMRIAGFGFPRCLMHVSDTELIDRNTAFHQHSGSLRIPYDQEYMLAGGCLMDDGTGFFKRENRMPQPAFSAVARMRDC